MTAWLARFRLLTLRHLGAHPLRSGIALATVAISVALVTGMFSAYGSLELSVRRFTGQLAGDAGLEVSGLTDAGFDAALLADIAADPAVERVVPMVRTVVTAGGRRTVLLGVDRRVTTLRSSLLRTLDSLPGPTRLSIYSVTRADRNELVAGPGLAADAGLVPGQDVRVTGSAGQVGTATLFSTVQAPEARALNGGHWAIANLATAQRLAGRGDRLDSVLVTARPGTDRAALQRRLLAAVGYRAVVAPPEFRVAQAADAASLPRTMTLFVAVVALTVAGFLVYNTFSVAALERQRELAVGYALGGSPRAAARDFLIEAGLLGLAGCLVGLPAGLLLGRAAVAALPPLLTESFDARVSFAVPRPVVPLALACGLACCLLGAWAAARRVLSVSPLAALRPADPLDRPETRRRGRRAAAVLAGAALVGAAVAVLAAAEGRAALAGGPLLLAGVLVAGYALAGPLTSVAAAVAGRLAGPLAAAAVARAPRRVWATTMTIALTVAIGIATHGAIRDVVGVVAAPSLADTDFYVKPTPPDVLPTDPLLPAGLAAAAARVPGVAGVTPGQAAYATLGERRVVLVGLAGGNAPAFRRATEAARQAVLAGTGAIVSRGLARTERLRVGGPVRLPTATGPRTLTVADVVDVVSLDAGMVVISLDRLRAWYERPGETWLEVRMAPGADPAAVRAGLERAAAGAPDRLYVLSGAQELRGGEQAAEQAGALGAAIGWMVTVAAALTLLNTLLLSVFERRRELAVLRALGAGRRFLRRGVLAEGVGIAVVGCVAGVLLGLPLQWVVTAGLSRAAAVQVPAHLASGSLLLVPLAFALVLLAPVLPVRQAARVDPAVALVER